ncbi:MAG: hypothetical protein H6R43_687, partial [Nitrospirae bacterium]|nr:hypothetical protein [Nitrospirota bacterium]
MNKKRRTYLASIALFVLLILFP